MENSKFTVQLTPSDPAAELGIEVWINDQCVFDQNHLSQPMLIQQDLPPDDQTAEHTLRFVLKNKTVAHTELINNQIVKDAVIHIGAVTFDEIDLGQIVNEHAVYQHDFNGHGQPTQEAFFGTMGCNGTVSLKFSTPIYLWILENM